MSVMRSGNKYSTQQGPQCEEAFVKHQLIKARLDLSLQILWRIADSDDDELVASVKSSEQKCVKCDKPATAVARTKDPFCSSCFCTYFIQRFRTTLGKSRLLKPAEKILIAFSGGPSSRVLLQVIEQGLSQHAVKKLQFIPTVLYIYEGAILNQNKEERSQNIANVLSITEKTGFPTFFAPLEQICSPTTQMFSPEERDLMDLQDREGILLEKLIALFENTKTLTAKENLLVTLRLKLLTELARRYSYNKVLVGDNANRVCVRLLGNIGQGRGSAIPLDTGYFDDRNGNVVLVRPLREFPNQEIRDYVLINNLELVDTPTLHEINKTKSITDSFISGLQENFPSTVNTIFRTGEKLNEQTNGYLCEICKAPLQVDEDEYVFDHLGSDMDLKKGSAMVTPVHYLALKEEKQHNAEDQT